MPDISNLKVNDITYSLKDETARTKAETAETTANNTNTKLINSKIIGTLQDETLEISLEIGNVSLKKKGE